MNLLVLGYGSAGRRHADTFRELGCRVGVHDVKAETLDRARDDGFETLKAKWPTPATKPKWDAAVVATPPDRHIEQVQALLDEGVWVLCEKPLCDLGQYQEAVQRLAGHPNLARLTFAFNYRWHRQVYNLRALLQERGNWGEKGWSFSSDQHRPDLPSWGLLVDHLPHTFDLLLWLSGEVDAEIKRAHYRQTPSAEAWTVVGTCGGRPFDVWDAVRNWRVEKVSHIFCPHGQKHLTHDEGMYNRMARDFLEFAKGKRPAPVPLVEALRVQALLERTAERGGHVG